MIQIYGSADPDPKEKFTDPENCFSYLDPYGSKAESSIKTKIFRNSRVISERFEGPYAVTLLLAPEDLSKYTKYEI